MLYFVAGIVENDDGVKELKYEPEAFVGDTKEAVKQKALIRWDVPEGEIDSLELVVLPFVS